MFSLNELNKLRSSEKDAERIKKVCSENLEGMFSLYSHYAAICSEYNKQRIENN